MVVKTEYNENDAYIVIYVAIIATSLLSPAPLYGVVSGSAIHFSVNHFLVAPSMDSLRSLERSCSSRQGAPEDVLGFLRSAPSRTQHHAASSQLAWTKAPPAEHAIMPGASPSLARMFQGPPPRKRGLA